ncbi:helix-turn-helix domain-containing protein [Deinococcus psychrotolerans]|uniref:Helix-turn-helix domain-containing protein n=1 Tax=Deinococcus psychrotolerans TaxID=2489213 RepID=A0A3G8YB26_9DEIO|nr:NadS family protein [Deinococcus psychrotolerans]AZI41407.1 helix-turn-helix domain-containing protein [Deinococcus psychrotolerans]
MNDELFNELVASVEEGGAILRGEQTASRTFEFQPVNVTRIRERLSLSQPRFAALLGISTATLRNWEQGRRTPEGPARVLLSVVDKYPEVLRDLNLGGG